MRTIDIHTHVLTEETMGLLQKEAPKIAPRLTPIDADFAVLDVAGVAYRHGGGRGRDAGALGDAADLLL
jgi:aminocarboxymuconate-semialdehyde decarboxylase